MKEITALREAIGMAHDDLEKKREEVEILESKLDYVLEENNPEAARQAYLKQPPGENQMILFDDEDCSITLEDCKVTESKNCLAIILGNAQLVLRSENLAEEEKEELRQIEKAVWRINDILSQEKNGNES